MPVRDEDLDLSKYWDAIKFLKRNDYTVVWLTEFNQPSLRPKPFTSKKKRGYPGRIAPESELYKLLVKTLNARTKGDCKRIREDMKISRE